MRAFLAVALLCLPISTHAQVQNQTCPVLLEKVNPTVKQSWSRVSRSLLAKDQAERDHISDTPDFSVDVRNVSGKDIRGLKLQAAFFDATEDLHLINTSWNARESVKDGQKKTIRWENESHKDGVATSVGWIVVIEKVLFEDGSTWEYSDATASCYGDY